MRYTNVYDPPKVPPSDARTKLGELAEHRHRDPLASLEGATELWRNATDPWVKAGAGHVMGLAQHELGRLSEAAASYRRSIEISVEGDFCDLEARSRANLAITLLAVGDVAGAERQIAQAQARASPTSRGAVALRQGLVMQRTGRLSEALLVYQRAQRWLEEIDAQPDIALVHLNRGILLAYQGNRTAALENLSVAEQISRVRQLPVLVAMATHNLAFALGRFGMLPDALAAFGRAEHAYDDLGHPDRLVAVLEADRCEILLLAGLVAEARSAATRAVDALVAIGDMAHLMEGRLLLARALLAGGDYPAANAEAAAAARGFAATSRLPWASLARYVAIQAEILKSQEQRSPPAGLLRRCRQIAAELDARGWPVEAVHVRTFAGRLALAGGDRAVARAELEQAMAARSRGTADLRAEAWHAAALLRLAEGDRTGAKRALARGMAVVDQYRASLGATELRAHAASHGTDLARLGIRLAVEERRAVDVLRWAERWRAGSLRRPSVRPPGDEQLAADLSELRQTQAELRAAALQTGTPRGDPTTVTLRLRIAQLEQSVRSRTLEASDDNLETGRVNIAAVRAALGERWLVEYVALEGQLHAVTVTRDRVRLHRLGPATVEEIEQEMRYLHLAVRRLLLSSSQHRAAPALAATAARIDDMLMAPLRLPAGVPLIVVPTGVLHGLPWPALPSLADRPTTVAPSAALWLGSHDAPRRITHPPTVVLVAGPRLPGADDEVRSLAELYAGSQTLAGSVATVAAVTAALESADVAHLAAHGRFRSDSPMFSSVLLADGPLTVYDLERLRHAPRIVVLAACDAAVSAVRLGDELLGTAATLIGLGVSTVVAPVLPVPDGSTMPFMVALHQRLLAGDTPAEALVTARAGQDQAVGVAFICIGSNDRLATG